MTKSIAARGAAFFVPLLLTFAAAALVIGALALFTPPAHAQEAVTDGLVSVPWGDIVGAALGAFGVTILALATKAAAFLPAQWRANEIINAAVQFGINATRDAVKGKALSFKVGSAVVERALEYVLARAPKFVEDLGGKEAVREMIIARVEFDAETDVGGVGRLQPPPGGAR